MATVSQSITKTLLEFNNTSIVYTVPANSELLVQFFSLNAGVGTILTPAGNNVFPGGLTVGVHVQRQFPNSTSGTVLDSLLIGPGCVFTCNPSTMFGILTTYS